MSLWQTVQRHALEQPAATALRCPRGSVDYASLVIMVDSLGAELKQRGIQVLGLAMDNSPEWALIDLAAMRAGACLVPLPPFFSDSQLRHCLTQAGVQAVICDQPQQLTQRSGMDFLRQDGSIRVAQQDFAWMHTGLRPADLPPGTLKITYTSGTTGEPRGVLLGSDAIEAVTQSLAASVAESAQRHLALMPLSVLLENIAGIYVPLYCGASSALPGIASVGLQGSASLDPAVMLNALTHWRAESALFTPQTLQGLLAALEQGGPRPALRFAALGGAVCSARLHARAQAQGIEVFEGYGLSEAASVVTLNTSNARRAGSVGRVLPHLQLRVSNAGEVEIQGPLFLGYLGDAASRPAGDWWKTGDLGHIDEDGYVYLTGRRRNVFVTAFGRNVSPEWVEGELCAEPAIAQAAVFGEARPFNTAVIVAARNSTQNHIAEAVARANARLPDYARVASWILADQPFSLQNALVSANGRVRHAQIEAAYADAIAARYSQEMIS